MPLDPRREILIDAMSANRHRPARMDSHGFGGMPCRPSGQFEHALRRRLGRRGPRRLLARKRVRSHCAGSAGDAAERKRTAATRSRKHSSWSRSKDTTSGVQPYLARALACWGRMRVASSMARTRQAGSVRTLCSMQRPAQAYLRARSKRGCRGYADMRLERNLSPAPLQANH